MLTTYGMVLHNSAELKGLGKLKCIDSQDEARPHVGLHGAR